jgi:hypothetical protein
MNFDYIKEHYKVPAEYGREIMFKDTRKGIIVQCHGNYIGVNFDDKKPGHIETLHPTWEVEYLGYGKVRRITRSQQRYREYLDSEWGGTFAEWLGID